MYLCTHFKIIMKRYSLALLILGLMVNVLFAQAPTSLHVSLLNNHFQRVNLTTAYGSSVTQYASAEI